MYCAPKRLHKCMCIHPYTVGLFCPVSAYGIITVNTQLWQNNLSLRKKKSPNLMMSERSCRWLVEVINQLEPLSNTALVSQVASVTSDDFAHCRAFDARTGKTIPLMHTLSPGRIQVIPASETWNLTVLFVSYSLGQTEILASPVSQSGATARSYC